MSGGIILDLKETGKSKFMNIEEINICLSQKAEQRYNTDTPILGSAD
jgi:hypothetical protein